MTTVGQLRRMLQPFSDDAVIVFATRDSVGGGYPEWEDCDVIDETRLDDADNDVPTGRALLRVENETT